MRAIRAVCVLLLVFASIAPGGVFAGTVHIVLSSDTSIWDNMEGGDTAYSFTQEFDPNTFSSRTGPVSAVFANSFRQAHADSYGTPFKISWFMHGGGWFQHGTNTTAVSTTYLIRKHWQDGIDEYGDELTYHFHHFKWSGSQWVMADQFADTIWDFDWVMSQMILDEGIIPASFRSGWNYMDNPYQQYLERWIPYRMEAGGWVTNFLPYHPSFTNYTQAGTMKGYEVRHYYMKDFTASVANAMFSAAETADRLVCVWSHQNESDFAQQIANVDANLKAAAASHPSVPFRYCTAVEGMQHWLGTTDHDAPAISLAQTTEGDLVTVTFSTNEPIYQQVPWIAAREYTGSYVRLDPIAITPLVWTFQYSRALLDRVAVAVTDLYGNPSIREIQDGSRRWCTQSEFFHSQITNVDIDSSGTSAVLATQSTSVLEQGEEGSVMPQVRRSYWLAQTFAPTTTSVSAVDVWSDVSAAGQFQVELRPLLPSGFPDDNASALLASGIGSFGATGTNLKVTAPLTYDRLMLDGRKYAILVRLLSGAATLRVNTTNPYAGGTLVRAFSLDWINIPNFDLVFAVRDGDGNLVILQDVSTAPAYASTRGVFVAQNVVLQRADVAEIELKLTSTPANNKIALQLRRTLPDGTPDLSWDAIVARASATAAAPGLIQIPCNWSLPEPAGTTYTLMAVAPEGGSSYELAASAGDTYPQGQAFQSDDLGLVTSLTGDLFFRVYSQAYCSTGSIIMTHDAEQRVEWTGVSVRDESPAGCSTAYRFRMADTMEDLNVCPWSSWKSGPEIVFQAGRVFRFIGVEAMMSGTAASTPTLWSVEVKHLPANTTGVSRWREY